MAEVRKSAKHVEARQKARDRAATFRARQDELEQLAAEYFVAADAVTAISDNTEQQIAELRARAQEQTARAREDADKITQRMLKLGISRAEVAERLGIPTRDVKKSTRSIREQPQTDQSPHAEGTVGISV